MMSAIKDNNMWSLTEICAKLYTVKGKLIYSHPPSTYDQLSNSDGTTTLNTYVVPVRETSAGQIDDDLCIERLISDLTGTKCIHCIDEIIGHREIEISDPDSSSTTLAQIFAVRWLKYPQHDSWHHLEDLDPVAVDEYRRSQGVAARALEIGASLLPDNAGDGHDGVSEASLEQALAAFKPSLKPAALGQAIAAAATPTSSPRSTASADSTGSSSTASTDSSPKEKCEIDFIVDSTVGDRRHRAVPRQMEGIRVQ